MRKILLLALTSFVCTFSQAAEDIVGRVLKESSEMNNQAADYLWLGAGFTSSYVSVTDDQTSSANLSGILSITGEYERMIEDDLGIGAYAKYNSTADDAKPSGNLRQNTLIAGGFLRFHWPKKSWDLYVSPGLGLMNVNLKTPSAGSQSSGLGLAYSFSMGVSYAFRNYVFAIENAKTYGLGTKVNGVAADDILFKWRILL